MSGIETLGVLASATQLAAYGIKIVLHLDEVCSALQNTSSRTKGHLKQVQELIQTTTLIERHESLWSPAIHRQLQATLLEAQVLYNLLQELVNKYTRNLVWKYWSILNGLAEKEVLISLDKLEREKSTLRLCIGAVNTDLLLNIQESINTFSSDRMSQHPSCGASAPPSRYLGGQEIPMRVRSQRETQEKAPDERGHDLQSGAATTVDRLGHRWGDEPATLNSLQYAGYPGNSAAERSNTSASNHAQVTTSATKNSGSGSLQHTSGSTPNEHRPGHSYDVVSSTIDATQHAGDQNSSDYAGSSGLTRSNTYGKSMATDKSLQVIGNINGDKAIERFYASRK